MSSSSEKEMPVGTTKQTSPQLEGGKGSARVASYEHHRDAEKGAGALGTGAAMGYEQELKRNLSMVTVLGLGAAIIAAPFGLSTSAYFSLVNGE